MVWPAEYRTAGQIAAVGIGAGGDRYDLNRHQMVLWISDRKTICLSRQDGEPYLVAQARRVRLRLVSGKE